MADNKNAIESYESTPNKELLEKFIVLQIESENFIIPLLYVNEIVRVHDVTEAPHQPVWVKGIMNLRDSVISLIDTRKRLGIKSFIDEAHKLSDTAKESHLSWIKALRETVTNNIPFTRSLDHTKCDFGKLSIDIMKRKDINNSIKRKLSEIEPIHKAIHDRGKVVVDLISKQDVELASHHFSEIEQSLIPKMLKYLDELQTTFQNIAKNIAVIIEFNGSHFAMLADEITKMKEFKQENKQKGALADSPFIKGVFDSEDGLYQELDLKGILSGKDFELLEQSNDSQPKQTVNLKELVKQPLP